MNRLFNVLFAILFVAFAYYLTTWVIGQAGIPIPPRMLQIGFAAVVVGLLWWIWNNGDTPFWKRGP